MAEIPNVCLNLTSRPENVLLVRQALGGVAEAIGLDLLELNDVSTAVSEACNNVALHAYEGAEGPLEVEIEAHAGGITVVVRDRGVGIHPRIEGIDEDGEETRSGGIGLPIMLALAQSVEFNDLDGNGTEVRLEFAVSPSVELAGPPADESTFELAAVGDPAEATAITFAPAALARTVLPRLLSALAARACFSTDRISDTQLLADALLAHADGAINGPRLSVGVNVEPRRLGVRIGPLHSGRAGELVLDASLAGLGSVLERLAESHEVSAAGSSEVLALQLADDAAH